MGQAPWFLRAYKLEKDLQQEKFLKFSKSLDKRYWQYRIGFAAFYYSEFLTIPHLAGAAIKAYYEEKNGSYYLGYLASEICQRNRNDKDYRREIKVKEGAKQGGTKKSTLTENVKERRLKRMKELIYEGHSVKCAAYHCQSEGLGSGTAIMKFWYRNRKKTVTYLPLS
jgi:hypothetical protein